MQAIMAFNAFCGQTAPACVSGVTKTTTPSAHATNLLGLDILSLLAALCFQLGGFLCLLRCRALPFATQLLSTLKICQGRRVSQLGGVQLCCSPAVFRLRT